MKTIQKIILIAVAMLCLSGCSKPPVLEETYTGGETSQFRTETEETGDVSSGGSEESETGLAKESGYVQISGEVRRPGVYAYEEGQRLFQIVEMAGGLTEEASAERCNLAVAVQDGVNYYIPSVYDEMQDEQDSLNETVSGIDADGRININTADCEQLMTLEGIGETRARAIIAYREQHGNFSDIQDIMNVSGIKQGTFERIRESIVAY